jgi:hypothetical protein
LKGYEQKKEDIQVDKELQVGAGTYFVLESCNDTVGGADNEQYEQITDDGQLPGLEDFYVEYLAEGDQFGERTVEQLHLSVEESMPE